MSPHPDFGRLRARVRGRKWEPIRDGWIGNTPPAGANLGRPPGVPLKELKTLELALTPDLRKDAEVEVLAGIVGLRTTMLAEGVYLSHRSVHVLRASVLHRENAVCSWSLSSAYHAAMFAVLSYLRLWGIAAVEVRGGPWIVDAWPEFYLEAGKPRKPRHVRADAILAIPCNLPAQSDYWILFKRLLEITKGQFFEVGEYDALRNTSPFDFAAQRNDLHYRTGWWPHDDLYGTTDAVAIALARQEPLAEILEDCQHDRYTVALAVSLQRAALKMIDELGKISSKFKEHAERLTWALDQVWASPSAYAFPS